MSKPAVPGGSHPPQRGLVRLTDLGNDVKVTNAILSEPTALQSFFGFCALSFVVGSWALFPFVGIAMIISLVRLRWESVLMWGALIASPHVVRMCGLWTPNAKNPSLVSRACVGLGRAGRYWFGKGSATIYEDYPATLGNRKVHMHHPHGMFAVHSLYFFQHLPELVSRFTMVATALRWFGGIFVFYLERNSPLMDASRQACQKIMPTGASINMAPGGFQGATRQKKGEDSEVMGFGMVKLALIHGYELVPMWCFGEADTYYNAQFAMSFRLKLNEYKIPSVIPSGWFWFPLLPNRVPLMNVVGAPVKFPQITKPTKEEVARYHSEYCDALKSLYDRWKPVYYNDLTPDELKAKTLAIHS